MICGEIQNHQLQFLESLFEKRDAKEPRSLTGVLYKSLSSTKDQVSKALGPLGIKIKHFAENFNPEIPHPDVFSIFNGELTSEQEGTFSRDASDIIDVIEDKQDISVFVAEALYRYIAKHKSYDLLLSRIDDPLGNLLHARFMPEKERNMIRRQKMSQKIDQQLFLHKSGGGYWKSEPSNFLDYLRNNMIYASDIEEANLRQKHFSDLGLTLMAAEIQSSVEKMKKDAADFQHYGFNKISLVTASVILGKQSGFEYISKPFGRGNEIVLDPRTIKWNFFPEEKDRLFDDSDLEFLHFAPRVYRYDDFEPMASKEMKKIVYHIENFPEALGYPIFDHLRVLVAGVDYKKDVFRLPDGGEFGDTNNEKVVAKLNFELIKQRDVAAILLGEKDGECYFVSYYMP